MATVELTLSALPAHVRTARMIAAAVARRTGIPETMLDEVRLAVGEACSRAVEAHRQHCPEVPIRVELRDEQSRFEVVVADTVPDATIREQLDVPPPRPVGETANLLPEWSQGVGLAVICGLADDVEISHEDKGVRVRMSWPVAEPVG